MRSRRVAPSFGGDDVTHGELEQRRREELTQRARDNELLEQSILEDFPAAEIAAFEAMVRSKQKVARGIVAQEQEALRASQALSREDKGERMRSVLVGNLHGVRSTEAVPLAAVAQGDREALALRVAVLRARKQQQGCCVVC